MGISSFFGINAKTVVNFVKNKPITVAALAVGGLGGFLLFDFFAKSNNSKYQELSDNLSAPERVKEFYKNGGKGVIYNKNLTMTAADGGKIHQYINEKGQTVCTVNTDKEGKVRNVGQYDWNNRKNDISVNFDTGTGKIASIFANGANLYRTIDADDGGKIYVYTDKNGDVVGSINMNKDGQVRNIAKNDSENPENNLSVNFDTETGKIRSTYVG